MEGLFLFLILGWAVATLIKDIVGSFYEKMNFYFSSKEIWKLIPKKIEHRFEYDGRRLKLKRQYIILSWVLGFGISFVYLLFCLNKNMI
jgi:hypothetical protein